MGKKGKGRKRREANFKASHGVKEMAPPPVAKEINAVPAKLRRIMQFQETGKPVIGDAGGEISHSKKQAKDSRGKKQEIEETKNVKVKKEDLAPGTSSAPNDNNKQKGTAADGQAQADENASTKPLNKKKREHAELLQLAEKIKARPVKTGISDRKRKFLEEKKKKRLSNTAVNSLMNTPKKDHVAFGEIVQAPPQLVFPAKNKVTKKNPQSASIERMRVQVIEAYRQRKGNKAGLGKGLPVLVPVTDDTTT